MRQKSLVFWTITAFAFLIAGCQVAPEKKAAQLRDDTISQTALITNAASQTSQNIDQADDAVQAARSQTNNPPATQSDLTIAHGKLTAAKKSLAPVMPAAAAINTNAVQAANLTFNVVSSLKKERSSWFSYRQRKLGWWILGILIVVGIVMGVLAYVSKTTGLSPILQVVGNFAASLLSNAWAGLKVAGTAVFHVFTLGFAYVGSKLGTAVAAKTAPAASPAPTATPAPAASK